MNGTDVWTVITIAGMTFATVITRSFFFLFKTPWQLPSWVEIGLRYAPIAALAAVAAPEIVMAQGQLIATWKDARLFAVICGVAWFYWKGNSVLGTIVVGMGVYLPLHIALGW